MTKLEKQVKRKKTLSLMKKNWVLYIFLIPMLVYLIIFSYLPLYGIQIAFKNYKVTKGIWGSPWVGFEHFKTFFDSYQFWNLLRNTLTLSIYSLIAGFPLPIIFAIILQYCISPKLKKTSQMISYAPHFISVVVFCGMITIFLANNGIINQILGKLGFDGIKFLSNPKRNNSLSQSWRNRELQKSGGLPLHAILPTELPLLREFPCIGRWR